MTMNIAQYGILLAVSVCCVGLKFHPRSRQLYISKFAEWAEFLEYDLRVFSCIFWRKIKKLHFGQDVDNISS